MPKRSSKALCREQAKKALQTVKNRLKAVKPSHIIQHVHERFIDPASKRPFWCVSFEGQPGMVAVQEAKALRLVKAQKDKGFEEPVFTVDYLGPRMCFNGPPGRGRPVYRWVHWKGFDEPTLLQERQLK